MTKLALKLTLTAAVLSVCSVACDNGASSTAPSTFAGAGAIAGAGGAPAAAGTGAIAPSGAGAGGTIPVGTGAAGASIPGRSSGAAGSTGVAGISGAAGAGQASAAGTGAAGVAGAAQGAAGIAAAGAGGSADPLASCASGLKPRCEMRETAACSSFVTVAVADLVKSVEIPFGPYGAIMEYNVGQGFEVPEESGEANCAAVAASFGEPADTTANIADLRDSNLELYTVYRPACMREGETYPVITWGNGTCGQTEGYGGLLRYVASYGYVVFASNSRYTGGNGAMSKALDFAEAANKDAESVYFNRLDLSKIGAMGHSQGGGATVTAADDSRVSSLIIWNASATAPKPFLAVSGDTDISGYTPESMASEIASSGQPSAFLYYHNVPQTGSVSGHLTLMIQPERVVEATVAWWDYMLKGDMTARGFFLGASCGLCGKDADFEFGASALQ